MHLCIVELLDFCDLDSMDKVENVHHIIRALKCSQSVPCPTSSGHGLRFKLKFEVFLDSEACGKEHGAMM